MDENKKLDNQLNNLELTNLETSEESKKYIEEMHSMEDQYEKRSNFAFTAIAIPILILSIITLKQMFTFSAHVAKNHTTTEQNQIANNNNSGTNNNANQAATTEVLSDKIYKYLSVESNRKTAYSESVKLNSGKSKGVSSIFVAQILRNNDIKIPETTINTKSLVSELEKDGWKKHTDYKQLQKGDVCFAAPSKDNGAPSHTYIFMGWVKEGKTDMAYVCDSQVSEYNNTLHTRNIDSPTPTKEKIQFFMRKE